MNPLNYGGPIFLNLRICMQLQKSFFSVLLWWGPRKKFFLVLKLYSWLGCLCVTVILVFAVEELGKKCPEYLGHLSIIPWWDGKLHGCRDQTKISKTSSRTAKMRRSLNKKRSVAGQSIFTSTYFTLIFSRYSWQHCIKNINCLKLKWGSTDS